MSKQPLGADQDLLFSQSELGELGAELAPRSREEDGRSAVTPPPPQSLDDMVDSAFTEEATQEKQFVLDANVDVSEQIVGFEAEPANTAEILAAAVDEVQQGSQATGYPGPTGSALDVLLSRSQDDVPFVVSPSASQSTDSPDLEDMVSGYQPSSLRDPGAHDAVLSSSPPPGDGFSISGELEPLGRVPAAPSSHARGAAQSQVSPSTNTPVESLDENEFQLVEDSEERETAPSSIAADPAGSHVADGLDGPVADNAQIDADWSSVAQDVNPLPTAATREDLSPVPLDSAISLTDAVDAGGELPLSSRETPVLPPKEAAADAGISAERPSEPAPLPVAAAAAAAVVAPVVVAPKLKTVPTLPPLPAQALAPKVPPPPPPTTRTPPPPPLASVSTPALPVVSRSTPAPATAAPPAPTAPASASPELSFGEETKLKKKRKSKQWFEEIFDEDYLHTLPFMTPQQTEREVSYLLEALELPQGGRVLDVGCGYGRHAMELAARGYKAVGLDLSLPLLIRATDAARRVGVNVDFVHGDMREMTFENEFDGAYCMFTTFGFFDDDTNRKVAAGMCKALKPGGKLVLEMINRDYLIGDLPCRVWWQGDGCVLLEEVDFNYFTSRLQVQRQVILENGRQLKQDISIRLYSLHEMGKLLTHAGFKVIEVSGNLDLRGRFYGNESRQLIVVAEKRAEAAS